MEQCLEMKTKIRTYSELSSLLTFEERFDYLNLNGIVGIDTFGFDRHMNQDFYKSKEWKRVRDIVILRDSGCDLGVLDRPIYDRVMIHHMNPITVNDIVEATEFLLNPEYLICVSSITHNALHYGDKSFMEKEKVPSRFMNDTCPWKN